MEVHAMRTTAFVFALIVSLSALAAAQEFADYENVQDGFKALFPGQPTVKVTTWKTQQGYLLPARLYTVDKGREHYSVLVADYTGIEQMAKDYVKTCPPGAPVCN